MLQWIPSHCDVQGNEVADKLAKEGAKYQQIDFSTNFDEEKNFIKIKYKLKWDQQHPSYNKRDPYYDLTRREQVVICRLRSNHNRLKHHMFNKFKIGQSAECTCGGGDQTASHILQHCIVFDHLRNHFWPEPKTESQKLYGTLEDLQCTASFIVQTGLSI